MSSFFASRGILLAAWGVVVLALAGGLTLALQQPPPPPSAAPVSVALHAVPAPADSAAAANAEPASETSSALQPAPQDPAEPSRKEERTEPVDAAPRGKVTVGIQPKKASEAAAPAAPESESLPAAEQAKAAPDAGTAPSEAGATAGLPAAPGEPPAGTQQEAAAEAPKEPAEGEAAIAAIPPPQPAVQDAGPAAAPETPTAPDSEPGATQTAAIPLIPPAPEELPYWERYRQPFNLEDPRPRIAVVLTGLGLSDSATEAAINKLPPAVTLSFSPYARGLERWIALARARGHEVMLDLPMEPATFPNEDPGPQGLLTNLTAQENLDRLDWVLSRGSAYVGLAGSMGSRFTASRQAMEPVLRDVKQRGLIFLDRRTTENSVVAELAAEIGLPTAVNNRSVDERQASRVAIDARLAQIERIALTEGFAVAMAQPYPVTLDRLAEWATELTGRGFVIAPISALADQQLRR